MKVGTKVLMGLLICAAVSQAQAVVTVQIASREAIDGTSLERLIIQMDTDGSPIVGLDLIITAPAGTINQELIGPNGALFQDDAVLYDSLLSTTRFENQDTYWLFNQDDLLVSNGSRDAPFAAYPQNGEGTTTGQSPDLDYLAGTFSLLAATTVTTQTFGGPQALVVNDNAPFTSRAVAQIVVQQGTQITLAFGQVSDAAAGGAIDVEGVGEFIKDVPEPAGLFMGVMSLGLLAARRRRSA